MRRPGRVTGAVFGLLGLLTLSERQRRATREMRGQAREYGNDQGR